MSKYLGFGFDIRPALVTYGAVGAGADVGFGALVALLVALVLVTVLWLVGRDGFDFAGLPRTDGCCL